jgi:hypothetical protein
MVAIMDDFEMNPNLTAFVKAHSQYRTPVSADAFNKAQEFIKVNQDDVSKLGQCQTLALCFKTEMLPR